MKSRARNPDLERFLKSYPPEVAKLFMATRKAALTAAPNCTEIVYDAYSAVATGYTFSGRFKEAFCHIAAYSKYVNLGFNRGAELADPKGLLAGKGKLIRHVRVESLEDLSQPHIKQFLAAAVKAATKNIEAVNKPRTAETIVKETSGKKRRPLTS
jgi:hypothetical protein